MVHDHPARAWLAQVGLELLWDAAYRWYSLPKRYYHTVHHANEVTTSLFSLVTNPSPALLLAARWHDAVYIAGAWNYVNEDASAAALLLTAKQLGLNTATMAIVKDACKLVQGTAMPKHLSRHRLHGELAILLDADMASMSAAYPKFVGAQHRIAHEQLGRPATTADLVHSAAWLDNFRNRRFCIFHTDTGRKLYEHLAQENIKKFINTFRSQHD